VYLVGVLNNYNKIETSFPEFGEAEKVQWLYSLFPGTSHGGICCHPRFGPVRHGSLRSGPLRSPAARTEKYNFFLLLQAFFDLIVNTGISCKDSSYTFHFPGIFAEIKIELFQADTQYAYPTANNIRFVGSDGFCLISYDNAVFFLTGTNESIPYYVEIIHGLNEKILECNNEYLVTPTQNCDLNGLFCILAQKMHAAGLSDEIIDHLVQASKKRKESSGH
jgi:hypothetical protein